ncbi:MULTISPECIES: cellulose biosynthesis protein BcsD [unclassified Azospirillum]|uniref:cellulose biosynthesis protein BcsD n=1 Tax=unclassified Azospirillum TaxID=2630922 RepID=UPI000B730F47|nr:MULTISPECIES: cellulose biosynthesis protein BcsD [unclassified Azospirillum]SNR84577.1 Cellulose synthase subunit D [Azospirillum sp. RU38E]SNS00300.1 Cellulose synthase subunit D [Azospirillum sp. RU37A]
MFEKMLFNKRPTVPSLDEGSVRTLAHFVSHSCSPQWRTLLAVLTQDVALLLDLPEAQTRFYRTVGTRLADVTPLPPCTSLSEVQMAASVLWREIGWGWVEFTDAGNVLHITHGAYPVPMLPDQPAEMPSWLAHVLEGTYSRWLQQLGGDGLVARWRNLDAEAGTPFLFDVGRFEEV